MRKIPGTINKVVRGIGSAYVGTYLYATLMMAINYPNRIKKDDDFYNS